MTLNAVTLLINGTMLSLALAFLVIILWYDARLPLNRAFVLFLGAVLVWNIGSALTQVILLSDMGEALNGVATGLLLTGFSSASVTLYLLSTAFVGVYRRFMQWLVFLSIGMIAGYQVLALSIREGGIAQELPVVFIYFFLFFDVLSLFIVWRYRRKLRSRFVIMGMVYFTLGQAVSLLNPVVPAVSFSTVISSVGVLMLSLALVRQEIVLPLLERSAQITTIYQVGQAISRLMSLDTVLREIVLQATRWLQADASLLCLQVGDYLVVKALHEMPETIIDVEIPLGVGAIGVSASEGRTVFLENYSRDWKQTPDLPFAKDVFGSVICVPLSSGDQVSGVLVAISGKHGKLFDTDDIRALEILGSQASISISYSQAIDQQNVLVEKLETSNQQLDAVLSGTGNPVLAVDRHFRIMFVNNAAKTTLQLKFGDDLRDIVPNHLFPASSIAAYRQVAKTGRYIHELMWHNKIYLCHISRLMHGSRGLVIVMNDVTELKELDRLKTEMVRMASHDLKNPLMGALAHVDLMRDSLKIQTDLSLVESLNIIEVQLERMGRIIRGILDIERLSAVTALSEVISIKDIINTVLKELDHYIHDHNITIVTDIPDDLPAFWGDSRQFERVLVNLIENAIKFSRGSDTVVLRSYLEDRSHIIIEVTDQGVGIPPEIQPYIFDRFYRGEQPGVEHITGSGLGLSIVKSIVENHNGKVWVKSEIDRGTTFYIQMPVISYSHSTKGTT